ncbi:hypothetical protein RR46_03257 [Papilio xuthus]|uniref:Uncharacterized protein n=1 Tax=Papilio xuthus TaxID=66420 RepID=A0A194QMF1_PAPXU|nr:hypothetical protein RR46_03257 [Papilio xuthus]
MVVRGRDAVDYRPRESRTRAMLRHVRVFGLLGLRRLRGAVREVRLVGGWSINLIARLAVRSRSDRFARSDWLGEVRPPAVPYHYFEASKLATALESRYCAGNRGLSLRLPRSIATRDPAASSLARFPEPPHPAPHHIA